MEITKDTTMGELLMYDRAIGGILMQAGMHCVGCPSHAYETLEQGCMVHGIEVEELLATILEYEASKEQ